MLSRLLLIGCGIDAGGTFGWASRLCVRGLGSCAPVAARWGMPTSAQPMRQKRHGAARLAGVVLGRGADSGAIIFRGRTHKGGQVQKMVDQAEIHRKVMSGEVGERVEAVNLLRDNFADLPDKEEAWKDLTRLTKDENWNVPLYAADALGSVFPHVPDKEEAWDDLIWLIGDTSIHVWRNVAEAIGSAFLHTPHKKHVWRDLHHLTHYEDGYVRSHAARALGSTFSHVPEKEKAWKDLHRLTRDEDYDVRLRLSNVFGSVFPHVIDKEEVWESMIRLMGDEDPDVRLNVAGVLDSSVFVSEHALDSIFQHIIAHLSHT